MQAIETWRQEEMGSKEGDVCDWRGMMEEKELQIFQTLPFLDVY